MIFSNRGGWLGRRHEDIYLVSVYRAGGKLDDGFGEKAYIGDLVQCDGIIMDRFVPDES